MDKYQHVKENMHLLVHCEAGISRSAAIALFAHYYTILSFYSGNFDNLSKTYAANSLVIKTLSKVSGVEIIIPQEKISSGGILLF